MKSKQLRLLVIPIALAVVLTLLLLTTVSRWTQSAHAAASSSNPATQLEFASSLGGSITSIAVSGTIAYVGQGGTFTTLDISDPTQISRLASSPLSNFATKIQVVGSVAYIGYGSDNGIGGLQIVDVSNPLNLQLLGSYTAGGAVADLEVVGDLVYLANNTPYTSSLQILDVTDPAVPFYLGGYFPTQKTGYSGIDVVNGSAYLSGWRQVLTIIDIQDPVNPVLQGSVPTWIDAKDIQVEGNLAIIVGPDVPYSMDGVLVVIDVSNPITPTPISGYQNYHGAGFLDYQVVNVVENFAYVGSSYSLDIIDLTTPLTPRLSSRSSFGALDLQIVGSSAYLASGRAGLQVVDISSPDNLTLVGDYKLFSFLADVQAQPPYIYITDEDWELAIFDGTDPSSPLLLTSPITPGYGHDLKVIGDFAYLNRYNYGFDIFDVTDPTSPTLLSQYAPSYGSFTAMTTDGNYAYIGELGNGMNVLDVSTPSNPQYLGNTGDISGSGPQTIKSAGNLVYIAAGNGGLVIVDVSNPSQPIVISRYGGLWAAGIDVVGNWAYVGDGSYGTVGLSIFDVSNPSAPVFLSKYPIPNGNLAEVQVVNHLAYVADSHSGLWIIDVSNPLAPVLQEHYTLPGWPRGLAVVDGFIYLACGDGGLRILYYSDPEPENTATPTSPPLPSSTPTASDTPTPPYKAYLPLITTGSLP